MNTSALYKEQMIREYIMKVNFKDNFSIKQIKEDLRRIIKETPGIDVKWKKDDIMNEVKSGTKVVESVKSISVAITDGDNPDGTPKVHSFTYFI